MLAAAGEPTRGRAEGEAEGKAEVVLKLVTPKFGPPAAHLRARIGRASSEELDRWAERTLTVATIEERLA